MGYITSTSAAFAKECCRYLQEKGIQAHIDENYIGGVVWDGDYELTFEDKDIIGARALGLTTNEE